jgi:hypothetical protein
MSTFIDTFLAVFLAQLCAWLVERYFKHRWIRAADWVEDKIKKVKL